MTARLGVDIGGTFTDLVIVDETTGRIGIGKILTTPKDPAEAVEHGTLALVAEHGVEAARIRAVIHATTLATNALIERTGARTALLATEGFRDTLEIAHEGRYDMYDLFIDPPAPLVPRRLRREVPERILADGSVLRPLDETAARAVITELAAEGVEAVAIALLHAYQNPSHERRLLELCRELLPGVAVSCSSDVVPEIREYERSSTTAANVYVAPLMARYLADLERRLRDRGIPGQLYVMQSSGGIALPDEARRVPVRLVESGPAAGALAASEIARQRGADKLLAFDMGGTTAKASVIDGGRPLVAREFEVARADRFAKGSGLPIRVPVVELIEIGAGGGSIARVDRLGLLKVGPDSAGAEPGPAAYGLGGRRPTVTDADLVLGYLDPGFFLGGRMRLDVTAARTAIEEHVAQPLGLDVTQAASGIHRVVNESMAAAARIHGIERGRDLRNYPLLAFGGAGPVHAWGVASILRSPGILVPPGAGAMSAWGLLAAPLAFDDVRSRPVRLDAADWSLVNGLLDEMEAEGRRVLASAGVPADAVTVTRIAEMRYVAQGHEVEADLPAGPLGPASLPEITSAFEAAYRSLYHRTPERVAVEAVNWRVTVAGPRPGLRPPTSRAGVGAVPGPGGGSPSHTAETAKHGAPGVLPRRAASPEAGAGPRDRRADGQSVKGSRPVWFAGAGGFVTTPVYDRYRLGPGAAGDGPAIVEERESTTVIGPGGRWQVEADGVLAIAMPGPEAGLEAGPEAGAEAGAGAGAGT